MAKRCAAAEGKDVTTNEGLDPDGDHPVQRAWRAHNMPQCGYYQAGEISGRAENRLTPALPHQTVHAVFPHTAFLMLPGRTDNSPGGTSTR